MKTYFVSSDVHGFFSEWQVALEANGFDKNNPEHIIILCGDLLDRGNETLKTLDFAYELFKENRFIFIRGNHEDLFVDMVKNKDIHPVDIQNGTYQTLTHLAKDPSLVLFNFLYDPRWDELLNYTVNFYETNKYVFVHAWIPTLKDRSRPFYYKDLSALYNPNWRNASANDWYEARWPNGMELWKKGIKEPNKTIVCGHWHCSWGWSHLKQDCQEFPQKNKPDWKDSFKPFADDGIIAIDACTAYSKIVNVLKFTEEEL